MATTKKTQGKSNEASLAEQLIAGTKAHFATATSVAFGSATYTPAQIEASLQQLATLRSDVEDARTALETKLAAENNQAPALVAFMRDFVQFVRATFSKSPDILADFGLQATKAKTQPTVQTKAAAAAKREATRAARGTKGSKQKAAITGDVTGVVITPVTATQPAAPEANGGTSTPASPAAGATTAATPKS